MAWYNYMMQYKSVFAALLGSDRQELSNDDDDDDDDGGIVWYGMVWYGMVWYGYQAMSPSNLMT